MPNHDLSDTCCGGSNEKTKEPLSPSRTTVSEHESSYAAQQELYGEIRSAPTKHTVDTQLPKISEKLVFPKQRKRPNSMDTIRTPKYSPKLKRPSTCGKEGVRNFSTPTPLKVKLIDTQIPLLSPNAESGHDEHTDVNTSLDSVNLSFDSSLDTPTVNRNRVTSPLSVRSFSTPLLDLRSNDEKKTQVQIKLNQISAKENLEEKERQLRRDILKYQNEVNTMKQVKKYRASQESDKLEDLIVKWRDIAERASNYMLNEAKLKIDRMGGVDEFRKRQKKSKLRKMKFEFDENLLYRIEEYMESEEYKNLDTYDQEEIKSKRREMQAMSEKLERGEIPLGNEDQESEDDNESNEFTMKDLYKQLKLDYRLVYGK